MLEFWRLLEVRFLNFSIDLLSRSWNANSYYWLFWIGDIANHSNFRVFLRSLYYSTSIKPSHCASEKNHHTRKKRLKRCNWTTKKIGLKGTQLPHTLSLIWKGRKREKKTIQRSSKIRKDKTPVHKVYGVWDISVTFTVLWNTVDMSRKKSRLLLSLNQPIFGSKISVRTTQESTGVLPEI